MPLKRVNRPVRKEEHLYSARVDGQGYPEAEKNLVTAIPGSAGNEGFPYLFDLIDVGIRPFAQNDMARQSPALLN
jgi:hypothetical protein